MTTYDNDNIFAKIIRGKIPSKKVFEDEIVFAFEDIAPAAPVHVLVVPKGEYRCFDNFMAEASAQEVHHFFAIVRELAHNLGVSDYRLITNNGAGAGQSVDHFHVHLIAGKQMGALLPGDTAER